MQNGTSAPTEAPIPKSSAIENLSPERVLSAIITAAASDEPPPKPALSGIFFSIDISTLMFSSSAAERNASAAL